MSDRSALFPSSYHTSRDRFRLYLEQVSARWPSAVLCSHRLEQPEDLTIDWISARAHEKPEKILLLTTAEHGIEGFVGSAVMQLFVEKFLHRLNPLNTSLLMVHTINPWGMKHMRRTNPNNIDLNRNFVYDLADLDPAFNPQYQQLQSFFAPDRPLPGVAMTRLQYALDFFKQSRRSDLKNLRTVGLLGQYNHQQGIHYGGDCIQEETQVVMTLFRMAFEDANQLVHLDMHTGWGPRYQMSLVNSYLEQRSSAELRQRYDYAQIVAATGDEFYTMRGDMIDYIYTLRNKEYPSKKLYATSFEFGTFGSNTSAERRGLRAMILENRLYWFGAKSNWTRAWVGREFLEFFYPQEKHWQTKALKDAEQAFLGILKAEGFLYS